MTQNLPDIPIIQPTVIEPTKTTDNSSKPVVNSKPNQDLLDIFGSPPPITSNQEESVLKPSVLDIPIEKKEKEEKKEEIITPSPIVPNVDEDSLENEDESINEKTEDNEVFENRGHMRSSSEVVPVSQKPTQSNDIGNDSMTHTRSPSDSQVLSTPKKFTPVSIQTNWSSYRVRTMQMEVCTFINYL